MKYSFIALFVFSMMMAVTKTQGPIYTIHYVKSYLNTQISANFGCGKSIVYGTYIHPTGLIDAVYKLANPYTYAGFNANCPRQQTYVKIFGDAQDYQKLLAQRPQILAKIGQNLKGTGQNKVIIQWKYLPQQLTRREKAYMTLTLVINGLKESGATVFLKAPASFFCLKLSSQNYILSQPVDNYIVQMYGQQTGKYIAYDDIFGFKQNNDNGYDSNCGKYPTLQNLKKLEPSKKFYIQKTLDSALSGYISQTKLEQFAKKAGIDKYFYDDFPNQQISL